MEESIPICRVCMQKSYDFVDFDMPLQNENEEDTSISYLDFFFECTRIEVEPHEGWSQCFCLPCGDELRSFYKFIKIAEMTDRILKENGFSKKNNSTFEMIAYESNSDDYMCTSEEKYLNGTVSEEATNSEDDLVKDQLGNSNYQLSKDETVSNQLLVDLSIEIFHDKKSTINTLDKVLDIGNGFEQSGTDLPLSNDSLTKCNPTYKNGKGLPLSGTIYKKGPSECSFCNEIFRNRKLLDEHLVKEHQRRTQPCEICGKMVIRMREHLLIHYRKKNDISRPKTDCPICLRKVSKQTISRHILYVHKREIKKQTCSECLQTFADGHKLKAHLSKGHNLDRNFKCPLCSRIFSSAISLNNHLRTHPCLDRKTKANVFVCDKCPTSFSGKNLLDGHRRVHKNLVLNNH